MKCKFSVFVFNCDYFYSHSNIVKTNIVALSLPMTVNGVAIVLSRIPTQFAHLVDGRHRATVAVGQSGQMELEHAKGFENFDDDFTMLSYFCT